MYSEFCLLHRLGLCVCVEGGGRGGGGSRIVNFTYFGVWGKGGFLFLFFVFLYRPFVGIWGRGDGRGREGSLSKLTIFWGSIEILGICLGIVRIGVKTFC